MNKRQIWNKKAEYMTKALEFAWNPNEVFLVTNLLYNEEISSFEEENNGEWFSILKGGVFNDGIAEIR